jgi:hypothetical protein
MFPITLALVAAVLPLTKVADAQWRHRRCQSTKENFATDRISEKKKASSTATEVGALIVAVISLAAGVVGPSLVYAKAHQFHSFLGPAVYAQVTDQSTMRGTSRAKGRRYHEPTKRDSEIINYTDYQRGGSN